MTRFTVMVKRIIESALDESSYSIVVEVQKTKRSTAEVVVRVITMDDKLLIWRARFDPLIDLACYSEKSPHVCVGQRLPPPLHARRLPALH